MIRKKLIEKNQADVNRKIALPNAAQERIAHTRIHQHTIKPVKALQQMGVLAHQTTTTRTPTVANL